MQVLLHMVYCTKIRTYILNKTVKNKNMSREGSMLRTVTARAHNKLFKMFRINRGLATQLQELQLLRLEREIIKETE